MQSHLWFRRMFLKVWSQDLLCQHALEIVRNANSWPRHSKAETLGWAQQSVFSKAPQLILIDAKVWDLLLRTIPFQLAVRGWSEGLRRWEFLKSPSRFRGLALEGKERWEVSTTDITSHQPDQRWPEPRKNRHSFFSPLFICSTSPFWRWLWAGFELGPGGRNLEKTALLLCKGLTPRASALFWLEQESKYLLTFFSFSLEINEQNFNFKVSDD